VLCTNTCIAIRSRITLKLNTVPVKWIEKTPSSLN